MRSEPARRGISSALPNYLWVKEKLGLRPPAAIWPPRNLAIIRPKRSNICIIRVSGGELTCVQHTSLPPP
jgi:hypothetical protein